MLSNYPDGVFDWTPNAPWNDSTPDDMEFECEVMETLSEHVNVGTLNNKGRELYNAILPQCDGWSVVERDVSKL